MKQPKIVGIYEIVPIIDFLGPDSASFIIDLSAISVEKTTGTPL